jgi:uncharacterized protein (TIGR00369 family)
MNSMQLVRQITALTGFTHSAGVEVKSAEPGKVELELARKPELLQFNGYFHGGVISGLADHAAGAAATTALPAGKIAVTGDLHVNFLAPASGTAILAKAHTLQVGNTICVVSVSVETETAKGIQICAVATVVLRVVDMPQSKSEAINKHPEFSPTGIYASGPESVGSKT